MRNMSAWYKQETNLVGVMQAEYSISSVGKAVRAFVQFIIFNVYTCVNLIIMKLLYYTIILMLFIIF